MNYKTNENKSLSRAREVPRGIRILRQLCVEEEDVGSREAIFFLVQVLELTTDVVALRGLFRRGSRNSELDVRD